MRNIFAQGLLHGADYNFDQWLDSKDVLDNDMRWMKEAACNAATIGVFSWSSLEPEEGRFELGWLDSMMDRLAGEGIQAIVATPSGAKPAWLSSGYPEVRRVDKYGHREPHNYRHNHCRTSPVYRDKTSAINRILAERYKDHPALLLWHVSNEYNGVPCYCDHCLRAFRNWLKDKYLTLENLNRAYWAKFWSHEFSAWEQIFPDDNSIHGLMIDWQRFISDQTIDFYLNEVKVLREITPHIPITTNFMIPDVGLDYWKLAKYVDIVSWDSYPHWHGGESEPDTAGTTAFMHDLHRSYNNSNFLLMESTPGLTNWQGVSFTKEPGLHLLSSLQAVAHGSNSVQYFQWRQSRGGEEKHHSAVIGHMDTTDTRIFQDVKSVGKALKKIDEVEKAEVKAEVAVVYDYENSWALDQAKLPRTENKAYQAECIKFYKYFWEQDIPVDILDGNCENLQNHKLLVIPMLYMFKEKTAENIRSFLEKGGTVLMTYLSGIVDSTDLCFMGGTPGELTEEFGIKVEYTDSLTNKIDRRVKYKERFFDVFDYADKIHLSGADKRGEYSSGPISGEAAFTMKKVKEGRACYLGCRPSQKLVKAILDDIIQVSGIRPCHTFKKEEGISVQCRASVDRKYCFVMNFNNRKAEIDLRGKWTDLIAGEVVRGKMELEAFDILVLKK